MAGKMIRVLARGDLLAPIHGAHARGMSRFVGRFDDLDTFGTPFTAVDETGQKTASVMPARVCSAEPTVFKQDDDSTEFAEQMLHLRYGDLWPFDADSARMSGVPFDPNYGGEYVKGSDGNLVNVAHRDALAALSPAKPAATQAAAKPALVTFSSTESK